MTIRICYNKTKERFWLIVGVLLPVMFVTGILMISFPIMTETYCPFINDTENCYSRVAGWWNVLAAFFTTIGGLCGLMDWLFNDRLQKINNRFKLFAWNNDC